MFKLNSVTQFLPEILKKRTMTLLPWILKPKLVSIQIEPTNHCNLHCTMCFSKRERGFMEFELFQKIIDELVVISPERVALSYGGESTLHPRFLDMMEYTLSKKLKNVGFFTNGTTLEKIVPQIIDLGLDWLIISLEGIGVVNEKIRIGANYEKIRDSILNLLKFKERKGKTKPSIALHLTHSTQTIDEINDFISYWVPLVDSVQVGPCYTENLHFANPKFFDKAVKYNLFCEWPFSYLAIFWNGDITICCHDINGMNVIGNIRNNSIEEVWNSNLMKIVRQKVVQQTFSRLCRTCQAWKARFIPYQEHKNGLLISYGNTLKIYKRA